MPGDGNVSGAASVSRQLGELSVLGGIFVLLGALFVLGSADAAGSSKSSDATMFLKSGAVAVSGSFDGGSIAVRAE
ncbi:MAG: hypothetical protein L6Q76_35730, partial [Polyangiaceae bacterium]|nr:hypothetical protein [Polyangiaceae bacterium]